MKQKHHFLLLVIFLCGILNGQTSNEVPYKELPKYSAKKASLTNLASKMLDSVGHKYFWATDSLIRKNLEFSFESDNVPRLFLNGVYIMSLKLNDLSQNDNREDGFIFEIKEFRKLRTQTLMNIKTASDRFLNKPETITNVDWITFFDLMDGARQYCDAIIAYRKSIGLPINRILDKTRKNKSTLESFESQIGADGLSNRQWMNIMEFGGGPDAWEKIFRQRIRNTAAISGIKKSLEARVEVGKLEQIEPYSKVVEGIVYTYYSQPPKQLSFAYSKDKDVVKGLVDWVVSINAGRSSKLSEHFRIGIGNKLHIYEKEIINTSINNRKIIDKDGNSIDIKIPIRYINQNAFWDIPINKVLITKDKVIQFIRENPIERPFGNKEVVIMTIENTKGDLLLRIKDVIKNSRNGTNEFDNSVLRLKENQ